MVDGVDPPGRVEIGHPAEADSSGWARPRPEATGNDERSGGAIPEVADSTLPSSTEQSGLASVPSDLQSPRRRVLAAAASIAVLALLVGWAIVRADGEPVARDTQRQQTVTTQVATRISLVEGSLPGEVDAIAISDPTFAGTVPTTMGASGSMLDEEESRLVLAAAGRHGDTGDPAPATEGPVTTPPPRPADELAAAEGPFRTRVGFIGLPPEGATPSPSGEIVVSMWSCYAPIGELSEIDRLPPLAALWVLADGRLIWLKYDDLPEGANSLSTGLLEQRLTPEGVELMRSEAAAALRTGEVPRCDAVDRGYGFKVGSAFDYLRADNEHLVRVMNPWSWLPATAWEDREIRAFVPFTYQVTISAAAEDHIPRLDADRWDPVLLAQLSPAAVDVIEAKEWEFQRWGYATFTTDEAHALAAALDDAGLERDGLWNAYRLDYQFEYRYEGRDMMAHIHFDPYVVVTGGGGCGPAFCIPVL